MPTREIIYFRQGCIFFVASCVKTVRLFLESEMHMATPETSNKTTSPEPELDQYDAGIIDRAREWVGEWFPDADDKELRQRLVQACAEIAALDDAEAA